MEMNVGFLDRLIRLLLSSGLFYLGLFLYSGSPLGMGFVIAGSVLMVTATVGFTLIPLFAAVLARGIGN
jgi:hypothetical protein